MWKGWYLIDTPASTPNVVEDYIKEVRTSCCATSLLLPHFCNGGSKS